MPRQGPEPHLAEPDPGVVLVLRDELRTAAASATPPPHLLTRAQERYSRRREALGARRRRRLTVAAVPLAISLILWLARSLPARPTAPTPADPGARVVTYRGVEFVLPPHWVINNDNLPANQNELARQSMTRLMDERELSPRSAARHTMFVRRVTLGYDATADRDRWVYDVRNGQAGLPGEGAKAEAFNPDAKIGDRTVVSFRLSASGDGAQSYAWAQGSYQVQVDCDIQGGRPTPFPTLANEARDACLLVAETMKPVP